MLEKYISSRMSRLDTESAFKILARARALEAEGKSIIPMEIGQPDFSTPGNIIEAAYDAMKNGHTGYTPTPGYPEVREAIANNAAARKGIKTSPDEVVVVPGGKPIIFFTMQMLVEPGDEVIYPNPSFPMYESCIKFSGGIPVPIPLTAEKDFRFDVDVLKQKISKKTKLIILNNPSNPTGGISTREDITAIAELLAEYPDVFVLSDEIYDRIVYDGNVTSIASLPGMKDRVIILDGLSKTYAMTGWRLGFGIMHPEFAQQIELLSVNSFSCAPAFIQMATIEALQGSQEPVGVMVNEFRERRDYLVGALNAIDGVSCALPKGAFYVMPDISSFGLSSDVFADRLLIEGGVAAASGTAFGAYGEGYMRLSYATSLANIKIAVERIAAFTKKLR
jgi:aspartate/methionine/tyrosine aminotransferase